MNNKRRKLWASILLSVVMVWFVGACTSASSGAGASPEPASSQNPCNPCAPASDENPCNPCAPASDENPCNPCAPASDENPCDAEEENPCNPCAGE